MNEIATTVTTGSANTGLVTLRGLITAAGTAGMGCDYIVDLMQYACFTTPSNSTYYPDGLHPAPALLSVWASAIQPLFVSSGPVISQN